MTGLALTQACLTFPAVSGYCLLSFPLGQKANWDLLEAGERSCRSRVGPRTPGQDFHWAVGWNTWGQDFGLLTFGVCLQVGSVSCREGNGTPFQYSCLANPMDGGAWWAAVHGVARSQTRLSDFTFTFHFHALEKEMATHSSVLAWRIPGMGEPGGLPSLGSHRVRHDWSDLAAAAAVYRDTHTQTQTLSLGTKKVIHNHRLVTEICL